jgi:hypothetical protein
VRPALKWIAIAFGVWIGLVILISIGLVLKVIPAPQQGVAQNRAPKPSRSPRIGEIVVANRTSFCGSTPAAFDEMMNWATRRDTDEMTRVLLRTGSSILKKGSRAKILDIGGFMFGRTFVRILDTDRECWVISEAVQQ